MHAGRFSVAPQAEVPFEDAKQAMTPHYPTCRGRPRTLSDL
jgi:hypothetical protein